MKALLDSAMLIAAVQFRGVSFRGASGESLSEATPACLPGLVSNPGYAEERAFSGLKGGASSLIATRLLRSPGALLGAIWLSRKRAAPVWDGPDDQCATLDARSPPPPRDCAGQAACAPLTPASRPARVQPAWRTHFLAVESR